MSYRDLKRWLRSLDYRGHWKLDASIYALGIAVFLWTSEAGYLLLILSYFMVDRILARHFTGSWLGQPSDVGGTYLDE